jgi:hypothetical protein
MDVPVMVDINRRKFEPLLNENHMNSDTNENDLTPKGDGSSQPDTINPNNTDNAQDKVDGSQTSQPKKPVSEARLRANRQNAKKSTGPKTPRGKTYSSRNALKHGLLAKQVLFGENGTPINPELHQLWESLHEQYGSGVGIDLLIEGIVVDYWRQRQAVIVEHLCFKSVQSAEWHFSSQGSMPNVQRYQMASQRAMLKNLELLDQQPPPQSEADEDEGKAPTPQASNPTPALELSRGLTVLASEPRLPECGSQFNDEAASGENLAPMGEEQEAA